MAAGRDGAPHRVSEHLSSRIIAVSFFRGAARDKTCPLVVVGLRRLHVPDIRIVEIAQHLGKKRGLGYMVRIKGCDDVVFFEPHLMQPGIVIAMFRTSLENPIPCLIMRVVLPAEMKRAEFSA